MAESFALSDYSEVVPGAISSVASFTVCLTYAIFPELRNLRYVELVFYVAINDLLASIGIALGDTENGSAACWYQGISTNVNYLSAILWSTVITYQVWRVVCQKNVIKDLTYAHIICWGIPTLVTLLPLSTSTYANPDDEANWCFVANRSGSPKWSLLFWFIVAFYGWLWLAMIFNVFMICSIGYRFYRMQEVPERVRATARKLLLYPIIITICWSLSTFVDLYTVFNPDPTTDLWFIIDGISGILAIAQGLCFAMVFFAFNPIVRAAWWNLFKQLGCVTNETNEDPFGRDDKSVSMVSVSMNGTNSTGESGRQSAPRRSSGGGYLGNSSITSADTFYRGADSIHAAIQDEVDFIHNEGPRMSQRLSILDFLKSDNNGQNAMSSTMATNLSVERTPPAGKHKQVDLANLDGGTANPMVSVAINDFGSVNSEYLSASQSGTGTGTLSVRRAGNGEFYGSDEESGSVQSGITSATGLSTDTGNTKHASVSSAGTGTTAGTKRSSTKGKMRQSVTFAHT